MRRILIAALPAAAAILLLAGWSIESRSLAQAAPPVSNAALPGPIPLAMLPRVVIPTHYRLTLTIDPTKARFAGHTEIDVDVTKPLTSFYLDGLNLNVTRAAARLPSGKTMPAKYAQVHKSGVATLTFAKPLPKGRATLVFDYTAPFDESLAGLYKVIDNGDTYAFTQFENIDARRAFPSFDEPGFKTPFDVTVIAPSADKVVANTPVANSSSAGNGMTKWVFQPTKPLPTYLIALAVGPLDIVNAGNIPPDKYRARPLPLRGVAAKGKGAQLKYALSLTPSVIEALEAYYGIGYPFPKLDILAVPDFAAGAMENAGAVTFREQLLLMGPNAPLDQKRSSLTVQSHELAHQWFGDLVTPEWWDDIWLNESFATWMEYKIAQKVRPEEQFSRSTLNSALDVMRLDELPSARQIHNPVRNPNDIDNAFDDITYSKGGAVLAMFESFVGPAEFQKGIHAYLTKFAYKNATARDFIGTVAKATNHPEIVQAFDDFINQPHIPLMKTDLKCGNGGTSAKVAESMYTPVGMTMPQRRWHVPMCLRADTRTHICQLVSPPSAAIPLGGVCPRRFFPNSEGAGYYRFGMSEPQWKSLLAEGPDLSPADRLTLQANVTAALRGGYATAADFFAAIQTLAPGAQWDMVSNLADTLHDMRVTGVIAAANEAKVQALLRRFFAPRLKRLGLAAVPNEQVSSALLRERFARLLVEEGRDPQIIAALSKAARVYLKSGGKNLGGIPPELRRVALRAGVMLGGSAFGNALIEAYKKSDDEYFKQSAIYALAGSEDTATLNRFLGLSLTPAVRTGDLRYVLAYFAAEPKAKQALWTWFKANFAALEKRLSRRGMGGTPDIQRYGCDSRTKADLNAFFAPRIAELVGTPRRLKEDNERIERCIAFRQAKTADIASALTAAAR